MKSASARFAGIPMAEMEGKFARDFVPLDAVERLHELEERTVNTRAPHSVEMVLLTSGFSEEESAQRLLNAVRIGFIQKPYAVDPPYCTLGIHSVPRYV